MVERRQLPPQIKRVELAQRDGGRAVIRYQLTVDVGVVDGKRKQLRKLDTFDLRRQLAPFNHRIRLAKEAAASHDAASVCAAMNRSISDDVTRRDVPI